MWAIEIELVGPGGWISRLMKGHETEKFETYADALAVAEWFDSKVNTIKNNGRYISYEVIKL